MWTSFVSPVAELSLSTSAMQYGERTTTLLFEDNVFPLEELIIDLMCGSSISPVRDLSICYVCLIRAESKTMLYMKCS